MIGCVRHPFAPLQAPLTSGPQLAPAAAAPAAPAADASPWAEVQRTGRALAAAVDALNADVDAVVAAEARSRAAEDALASMTFLPHVGNNLKCYMML